MRNIRVLLAVLILTMIACGGSSTSPSGNSTLTVMLKDSPFSDAKALLVTFSMVSAHASGGSFVTVPFSGGASSRTCDLKRLTAAQDVLGTGALAAGHYTQIRLVVSTATIYFDTTSQSPTPCASSIAAPAGRNAPVMIPSGQIDLNREFDLTIATATTITLDFDGDQSVKETGNGVFLMTPVVTVVSLQ
jgi:hypothetical protein